MHPCSFMRRLSRFLNPNPTCLPSVRPLPPFAELLDSEKLKSCSASPPNVHSRPWLADAMIRSLMGGPHRSLVGGGSLGVVPDGGMHAEWKAYGHGYG